MFSFKIYLYFFKRFFSLEKSIPHFLMNNLIWNFTPRKISTSFRKYIHNSLWFTFDWTRWLKLCFSAKSTKLFFEISTKNPQSKRNSEPFTWIYSFHNIYVEENKYFSSKISIQLKLTRSLVFKGEEFWSVTLARIREHIDQKVFRNIFVGGFHYKHLHN